MKTYKTVKIDDIEQYPGWQLERTFLQVLPEKILVSKPREQPPQTYSNYGAPQFMEEAVFMTKRIFALLSKDTEIIAREDQLSNRVRQLEQLLWESGEAHEKALSEQAEKLASDTAKLADYDRIVAAKVEAEKRVAEFYQAISNEQKRLTKLKTAIGEIRFREILEDPPEPGEDPTLARFRQLEPA